MPKHAKALLLLLVLLTFGSDSFACQCGATGHNAWEIARLRASGRNTVFEGKVVGLRLRWNALDAKDGEWIATGFRGNNPRDYPYIAVTLEVSQVHRGNVGKTIEINTGVGGGDCGFLFRIGEQYLVFASPLYSDKSAKFGLWTNICSGTARINENTAELRYLRGERPRREDLINFWEHDKLDALARAQQASRKYRLGSACVSIDGDVGDGANVFLLPAPGDTSFRHDIWIIRGADGRFCSEGISPGRYYALLRQDDNHGPILMSYSPGVYRREDARMVEVRAGETAEARIRPARLRTQRVSIFIFLQKFQKKEGLELPKHVSLIGLDDGPMSRIYDGDLPENGVTQYTHLTYVSFPRVLPGQYLVWVDDPDRNFIMKKRTITVADRSQSIFIRLKED